MGAKVSVVNETPYTWHYATQDRGFTPVSPYSRAEYEEKKLIHRYIYVRYDHHTRDSFTYEFNTFKGDTSFILRETYDRSQIQMHCTSEGGTHYCPNYAKIEEDEKQRRQEEERRRLEREQRIQQELDRKRQMEEYEKQRQLEEERRRLERLEHEQRIQQELDRESESSRLKLSRATERLREKQSFRGHEQHHERTQVLHQQIEDDAAAIERDECPSVVCLFLPVCSCRLPGCRVYSGSLLFHRTRAQTTEHLHSAPST